MKKIILIDFDGVIRHWNGDLIESAENRLDLPIGTLYSVAFSKPLLVPTITGQQSHTLWVKQVLQQLSSKYNSNVGSELVEAWENTTASIDKQFIDSIRAVSPNSKLVLVTNATDKLSQDILNANLDDAFDLIINSSELLVAKPDEEFFKKAIELVDCTFNDCMFIDDTLENVHAAQKLGILCLHHKEVDETLEFIKGNCT